MDIMSMLEGLEKIRRDTEKGIKRVQSPPKNLKPRELALKASIVFLHPKTRGKMTIKRMNVAQIRMCLIDLLEQYRSYESITHGIAQDIRVLECAIREFEDIVGSPVPENVSYAGRDKWRETLDFNIWIRELEKNSKVPEFRVWLEERKRGVR